MHIKVLVRRVLPADKGKQRELMKLIAMLRAHAAHQNGYLTSEVLCSADNEYETVTFTAWRHIDAWKSWLENEEQKNLQKKIDELGCVTRYEVFQYPAEDLFWAQAHDDGQC